MSEPKIEIELSQSACGTLGCILNFKYTVIDGYREPADSANIVYGEAIHKYRDIMFKTHGHIPTAREAALSIFNTPKVPKEKQPHLSDQNHMLCSAFNYWEMYVKVKDDFELLELNLPCWKCKGNGIQIVPHNTEEMLSELMVPCPVCKGSKSFNQPAAEVTFRIKFYEDEFVIVYLTGTIDGLGKIKGGCYSIQDLKTTSSWDTRSYFGQYELSRQLRFYRLALLLMSIMYPDSILGQIGKTKIGAFIEAIFVKPAANDNKYGRSDVFQFDDDDLNFFRVLLEDECRRISLHIKTGYYPKQGILNGSCMGKWGRCSFWNVCKVKPEIGQVLLSRDFVRRKYNPLNYSGR